MYVSSKAKIRASQKRSHAHRVSVLVLWSPRPLASRQPTVDGSRVLVTLRLSSPTSVRMVTGVHRETSNTRLSTHPSGPSRLSNLLLLMLLTAKAIEVISRPTEIKGLSSVDSLANRSYRRYTARVEFSYFSTLQLDQRPPTVNVGAFELDASVPLFPIHVLLSHSVGDDLTESARASTQLHLARGRERNVVYDRTRWAKVQREDVPGLQGQRSKQTEGTR